MIDCARLLPTTTRGRRRPFTCSRGTSKTGMPSSGTWISPSQHRLQTTSSRTPVFRSNNAMRAKWSGNRGSGLRCRPQLRGCGSRGWLSSGSVVVAGVSLKSRL